MPSTTVKKTVQRNDQAADQQGDSSSELARHWYALFTRNRHEQAVEKRLQHLGFESFLPLKSELRRWSDRKKIVHFPLFPGYLFVRCNEAERRGTFAVPGLVRYVAADGIPIAIPENELNAIREVLQKQVPYDPNPHLEPGRQIEVISGPLKGVTGIFVERSRKGRLQLHIHALGRGISVEIDSTDVRPTL